MLSGCSFPDLIVGAPFFFSEEEGGAVYVYTNNKDHCLNCMKPLRLTGKRESRFGTFFFAVDVRGSAVSSSLQIQLYSY